jgi:hypothetical protein
MATKRPGRGEGDQAAGEATGPKAGARGGKSVATGGGPQGAAAAGEGSNGGGGMSTGAGQEAGAGGQMAGGQMAGGQTAESQPTPRRRGAAKAAGGGVAGTQRQAAGGTRSRKAGDPAGGGGRAAGGGGATRSRAAKPDLKKDLREFAAGRPQGWSHDDWLSFLEDLQSRGHNIEEREEIGRALERERLDIALEKVGGVGPQKRRALVERFGTLWSLRNASAEDIASAGNLPQDVAQRVRQEAGGS